MLFAGLIALMSAVPIEGITSAQEAPPKAEKSIRNLLRPGQNVAVKDADGRYAITTYVGGPVVLSHRVVAVAKDHVVVRDFTEFADMAIPVYSIKSVATVRLERAK